MSSTCPRDNANCGTSQFLHCLDQPRHLLLRNDRYVSNRVQHRRCNCGISTVFSTSASKTRGARLFSPRQHRENCGPAHRDVEHLVNVLQQENLRGLLNSETMGTCLCAPTGMMTTLLMNCNSGFSTVFCAARRSGSGHLSCTQRARQPYPRAAPVEHHEAPVWPNNGHVNSMSRNCNREISMVC